MLLLPLLLSLQLPPDLPASEPISHGPVLGAATSSSIVVWARFHGAIPARVTWSASSDFTGGVRQSPWLIPGPAQDYTLRFRLYDLEPEREYYYFIETGAGFPWRSDVFSFHTSPTRAQRRTFRVAVFSDMSSADIPAAAYWSAASDGPVMVLQIGDLDHRNPAEIGPEPALENWRKMHRDHLGGYAAGRDLTTLLTPYVPLYHVWDDHDFGANNMDGSAPWKNLATRAFREYFPLPPLPDPDLGLWYSVRYAQAEFYFLDLRSQRDSNDAPDSTSKSMLDGPDLPGGQDAWLKQSLAASDARWKFLVSSSCWNPRGKQVDSWAQFQAEQQAIVDFVRNHRIHGVIVISGDIHSGGAIDDGTNAIFPEISVPATNVPRPPHGCTGGPCGDWSVGVIDTGDPAGYALITVEYDPYTATDRVILEARAADGTPRLTWEVR